MKNRAIRKNNRLLMAAVICLILGICAMAGQNYAGKRTESITDSNIASGAQDTCVAYDETNDILLLGTHNNELVAYQGGEEFWRQQASGAYREIIVNDATGQVFAGNENNYVYTYDLMSGELENELNVQRRVVSIDVSEDAQTIAVATVTGTSKSNVMLFGADGTELLNEKYTIKVSSVAFTADDQKIIFGNNRGEIIELDLGGQEITRFETNYSIVQMISFEGGHLVLCKNGAYYSLDDDLQVIRQGVVDNTSQAVVSSIGTDASGEYITVGSEEGILFILNGEDEQIYTADTNASINGFAAAGETIYAAGEKETVSVIHVGNLANVSFYKSVTQVLFVMKIILLLAGVFFLLLALPKIGDRMRRLGKRIWRQRVAYILLIPTFLLVWFFNYRGILTAFVRAFTNWSTSNSTAAQMDFVGLDNFRRMVEEGYFLIGMKNLLILVVTGVVKVLTVPLLVAWLVYVLRGDKKKYIFRFLLVLPIVVPGVVSALVWQKIYDPNIGLLNELLEAIGLENLQHVWLGDSKTAIWAVVFMGFPFISAMAFLVYYGGFIGIGREIEESARVDGANRAQIFWKIQLPLIRPQLSTMITLQLIGTMQDFNNIYILTGGGPGTSTYVPALELYLNVAQFGRYGYACALGVVLFLFTMAVTLINMRLTRERSDFR